MKKISTVLILTALFFAFIILSQHQLFGEDKYESKERRDPFIPLIAGQKRMSVGLEAVESVEDIKFEGVIFDPSGNSMAVLNGEIVKEGDKMYNVEVVKIYNDAITIKVHDNVHTVGLIEEGGEDVER